LALSECSHNPEGESFTPAGSPDQAFSASITTGRTARLHVQCLELSAKLRYGWEGNGIAQRAMAVYSRPLPGRPCNATGTGGVPIYAGRSQQANPKKASYGRGTSMIASNDIALDGPQPLRHADFVFLWHEDLEHGVFVTSDFYDFLERFYAARNHSKTWGEFLSEIGDFGRRFVSVFCEYDRPRPQDEDLIEDIRHDVFILDDREFPITQCADETYNDHAEVLPPLGAGREIRTEYGADIGLYLKSDFLTMKEYMDKTGFAITSKRFPFISSLHDYQ
jgi:hypothetical protein